ncbi:MAG: M48 family metalloprotease [Balneolaceae bacterium]
MNLRPSAAAHSRNFLYVILTLFFVTACVVQRNPVSGNKRAFAYSWDREVQIGTEADREISAHFGIYPDEEIQEYITELGEELLAVSHMRREDTDPQFKNTPFTFRVLNSPVVNAFALPGGYVYVTSGLMVHLNNEAQLAVVVGHEIGHVAARHASQRALTQTISQIAVIGGSILGQELLGLPGQTLMDLSGTAAQLLLLSYSRDHERESDRLGVEYSARVGYAASEGSKFFTSLKRISEKAGQSIPSHLSTHPDPGERERNIPRMAKEWEERGFEQHIINDVEYMNLIDGFIFGENPREGFVENDMFVHPDLEFQFPVPGGWQLINQPTQVVIISPAEDAIILLRLDSEAANAQASVRSFLAQDGVNVVQEGAALSSGEWNAYEADATATSQGNQLGVYIYAVEYQDNIYRFVNFTSQSAYENYKSVFTRTTGRFDRLTDERILNIEPVRIKIVEADRRAPFNSFLPDPIPMNHEPLDIAILNQVELDEIIQPGTLLKIPSQEK